MRTRPTFVSTTVVRGLLLAAVTSLLAGCISLFPETDPAQLYRFGSTEPQVQQTPSDQPGFDVFLSNTGFEPSSANERILTVTGTQAAYIKGARWVTSAVSLFNSALQHAFDIDQGPARLISGGEITRTDFVLKLDVRTFEARYDNGQDTAPTVVVKVHAALNRSLDQALIGDQGFQAAVTASDNRMGAITQAFDLAVARVLEQLVNWVNTSGTRSAASSMDE